MSIKSTRHVDRNIAELLLTDALVKGLMHVKKMSNKVLENILDYLSDEEFEEAFGTSGFDNFIIDEKERGRDEKS